MSEGRLSYATLTVVLLCLGSFYPSRDAWPAQPNRLVFTVEPVSAGAGQTLAPIEVSVEDSFGNLVTTDNTSQIQLSLATATLNGTVVQTVANGVATFSDLSINQAGTGYTLLASSVNVGPPPLSSATSTPFDIGAGEPVQLAFVQQPSDTPAGEYVSPAVTVEVEDIFSNIVDTDSGRQIDVTITLCNAPIALESETDSAGVATFPALRLNTVATGDYLAATSIGLAGDTSTPFNVLDNSDRVFFGDFDDPLCTP